MPTELARPVAAARNGFRCFGRPTQWPAVLRGLFLPSESMGTLRELDIKSRGAAALVDEWWEGEHKIVRTIWRIEDVINLFIDAAEAALDVQKQMGILDGRTIPNDQLREGLICSTAYFLNSIERLRKSSDDAERAVQLFESQGFHVEKAAQLRAAISTLPTIAEATEAFLDKLEWEGLEKELIPTERLVKIGQFLHESGQASA
jgi:hypothetical protein